MIQRHSSVFPFYGEAYSDFMSYVTQYYSDNPALPQEILLPDVLDEEAVVDKEAKPAIVIAAPAEEDLQKGEDTPESPGRS